MESLQTQIKAVRSCIQVAKGAHRELQESALSRLEEELKQARASHVHADPEHRREQLLRRKKQLDDKIASNAEKLRLAKVEVVRLEGFLAGQNAKSLAVQAELDALPPAALVGDRLPVVAIDASDPDEHGLLQRLQQAQLDLASFRSARERGIVAPPGPPPAAGPVFEDLDDTDLDLDLGRVLGLEFVVGEDAKARSREGLRTYLSKARAAANAKAGIDAEKKDGDKDEKGLVKRAIHK